MKKTLAVLMCLMALTACTNGNNYTDTPPTPSAGSNGVQALRTMIAPTDKNPIKDNWTVLGEVGYIIDGEYCDILLATDAQSDKDGYIAWDDSQNWALVVKGESRNFVLYNKRLNGKAYMNVTTNDNLPIITLIQDTPVGIGAARFSYAEDAFYEETLVETEGDGNSIFSSFPEYGN